MHPLVNEVININHVIIYLCHSTLELSRMIDSQIRKKGYNKCFRHSIRMNDDIFHSNIYTWVKCIYDLMMASSFHSMQIIWVFNDLNYKNILIFSTYSLLNCKFFQREFVIGNHNGLIVDVRIAGCSNAPCQLGRGETYNVQVDFLHSMKSNHNIVVEDA